MYTFVILSSLAVGFYLALMLALYRDGRKRRRATSPVVHKISRVVLEFDTTVPSSSSGVAIGGHKRPPNTVHSPVTTLRGNSGLNSIAAPPVKLV